MLKPRLPLIVLTFVALSGCSGLVDSAGSRLQEEIDAMGATDEMVASSDARAAGRLLTLGLSTGERVRLVNSTLVVLDGNGQPSMEISVRGTIFMVKGGVVVTRFPTRVSKGSCVQVAYGEAVASYAVMGGGSMGPCKIRQPRSGMPLASPQPSR